MIREMRQEREDLAFIKSQIRDAVRDGSIYVQGGEGKLAYTNWPHVATLSMREFFGKCVGFCIVGTRNDQMYWYVVEEKMNELALFILEKQKAERGYIESVEQTWKERLAPLEKEVGRILGLNLTKLSSEELIHIAQHLSELHIRQFEILVFIDTFDLVGEKILGELLKKEPEAREQLSLLIQPPTRSHTQRERLQLLRIAQAILEQEGKQEGVDRELRFDRLGAEVQAAISAVQQEFFWIKNNYGSVGILENEHFVREVQTIIQEYDGKADRIRGEIVATESEEKERAAAKERLWKILSEEQQSILHFFEKLGELRDERKRTQSMTSSSYKLLLEELSRRFAVEVDLLEYSNFWDIKELLSPKASYSQKLQARREEALNIPSFSPKPRRRKPMITLGSGEARRIRAQLESKVEENATELKGSIANKGKAKGVVKIINKIAEFGKFREGDILVSVMTRPEFVPLVKKAAAIVTDDGGLTCHAAIVSREVQKPCIIGTRFATKALQDGDLVDVDATRGIIRILERSKRT